jgi:septal ring factor EnvC (AmiA/AmiB activator)
MTAVVIVNGVVFGAAAAALMLWIRHVKTQVDSQRDELREHHRALTEIHTTVKEQISHLTVMNGQLHTNLGCVRTELEQIKSQPLDPELALAAAVAARQRQTFIESALDV